MPEHPKNQTDDSEMNNSMVMPQGKPPVLRQVNPQTDVTPQTKGQTTSTNQLKPGTSGFEQK